MGQDTGQPSQTSPEVRERVLRGVQCNRLAGLHFPGYFLELAWEHVGTRTARLTMPAGLHNLDARGEVDIAALAILADTALATTSRLGLPAGTRLATIHLSMQFLGVALTEDAVAEAEVLAPCTGTALRRSLSSCVLSSGSNPVCYASGEFVQLDPPAGVTLAPLPWQRDEGVPTESPAVPADLTADEQRVVQASEDALVRASPQTSFIEEFWGGRLSRTANGASLRVAVGPHIGNRVGHVQGGIQFGIAARTACAAVPGNLMLSHVAAWYISPGRGEALAVRSSVIHAGKTLAVVRTQIKTDAGERVLEAVSHHVQRMAR